MENEEPVTNPKEPPRIRRLDPTVVNRIAAGEVVQRPSSAVKELIENSLDAGATTVSVAVKDGGLKLIIVSDNGHGIRFEDLPILCERHTTSKLSKYEDLQMIKSMGFRGEALSSMTYVGHVTVTTITEGQVHGYRVSYKNGMMENEPEPCAAVKGTQIWVENLFYNMIARRKAFQNCNDEYPKIVDLISRFAIHNINVSFQCRKHGTIRTDVHTGNAHTRLDAIKTVYGISVARNLMEIEVLDQNFKMDGFISSSNYIAKKTTMILFINDRLVECSALKRAIEVVYGATLPKASKPFIYMSISLPPDHVDVNIHPTKREVSLLNQESLIDIVQNAVETKLMTSNTSKTFQTQAINSLSATQIKGKKETQNNSTLSGTQSQRVPVNQMVRIDSRDPFGRLHAYMQVPSSSHHGKNPELDTVRNAVRMRRNSKDIEDVTAVDELVRDIDRNVHPGLLDIVKNCTYVGLADETFALLQYNTHLYLMNVINVSKELMYQQAISKFGKFNAIQLSNSAPLQELLIMALKDGNLDTSGADADDDELKNKIAEMNTELLKKKAELLDVCYGIWIDENGNLIRLPVVLEQYTPDMDYVPEFLLSLGNDVDWDDETGCYQTIAASIANFYAMHPPILPNPAGNGIQFYKKHKTQTENVLVEDITDSTIHVADDVGEDDIDHDLVAEAETAWSQREWTIQHVLFPAMRLFLKPPKAMASNGTFVQVASLEKLYKIFERC